MASLGDGHRLSVNLANRNRHPPPQAEPISGQGEGQVQVLQAASLEQDIEPLVGRFLVREWGSGFKLMKLLPGNLTFSRLTHQGGFPWLSAP